MPSVHVKSHARRKGRPVGWKPKERNDEQAVAIRKSSRWTRLSQQIRRERPICQRCEEQGLPLRASSEVHHVRKVATHPHLAFNPDNLRALCHECHTIEEYESK